MGDMNGYGAHLFLRLGAALVAEPAHILEALGIKPEDAPQTAVPLEGDEKTLYELLEEPLPRDELILRSGIDAGDALTALVMLEMRALVKEELGVWRRI
jgi:predicted Rossmann fold nucleotide-binding protein DprA/Smf involved in DNA uptake